MILFEICRLVSRNLGISRKIPMERDSDQFETGAQRDLERLLRDLGSGRDLDLVSKLTTLGTLHSPTSLENKSLG